jgi:uncharacterized protein YjbI with pentapeptide repeats
MTLAFLCCILNLHADIYQWAWVNPADTTQGKIASTTVCRGGAGVSAVPNANLSARDLTQAYLINTDLTNADLSNTLLGNADLTNANLTGASITGANFNSGDLHFYSGGFHPDISISLPQLYSTASYQKKDLHGIQIDGIDLTDGNFTGQNLTDISIRWAVLTNADFGGAIVKGVSFYESNLTASQLFATASYQAKDLSGTKLYRMDIRGANFASFDLTNATIADSNLTNIDFTESIISGVAFGGSNLTASQLYSTASYRAKDLGKISLLYYDLSGWNLAGQNLIQADITCDTLTNTNLAGANLTSATAWYNTIINTNMKEANLTEVQLYDCKVANTDFTRANLTNADFHRSVMNNINLTGANLSNAQFWQCALTNSNLTGAIFSGANLIGTDLRGSVGVSLDSALLENTIMPDGKMDNLSIAGWTNLIIRNYPMPIHVTGKTSSVDPFAKLEFVLDDNKWGSTICFDAGTSVTLAGELDLSFADDVDRQMLAGATFKFFDWTDVKHSGQFSITSDWLPFEMFWDFSNLYTSGEVRIFAVPEPRTGVLLVIAGIGACWYFRQKRGSIKKYKGVV